MHAENPLQSTAEVNSVGQQSESQNNALPGQILTGKQEHCRLILILNRFQNLPTS